MDPFITRLLVQLLALLALLVLNGFFVSVEFAYVTVPRPRIRQLVEKGDERAGLVEHLLSDTDRVLAASQLGITIASLGLGWVGENVASEIIRLLLAGLPQTVSEGVGQAVGLIVGFAIITSLHIIVGEQTPKLIAISAPDRVALFSAPIVNAFDALFRPIVAVLDNATTGVARLLGVGPVGAHQTVYTIDELKQLISETQQRGELKVREREMIHRAFEFGDRSVREVMIPRPEMVAFEEHTPIAEFLQTFAQVSHARFPIYSETIDNITGFVAIKDVLHAIAKEGDAASRMSVHDLARPATFVPELKSVGSLFAEMQALKTQLAVVIDEFGGTAGMVTLEELIEEIVGRVEDEQAPEPPQMEAIDANTTLVDAQLRVEEVNQELGLDLPESPDYETIAGLTLDALRRIPQKGEHVRIGNVRVTVTRMEGLKITQLKITRL